MKIIADDTSVAPPQELKATVTVVDDSNDEKGNIAVATVSPLEVTSTQPNLLSRMRIGVPVLPFQNVQSYTLEQADSYYNFNCRPIDYGGEGKNSLVAELAETRLVLMAENPAELARFLPPSVRLQQSHDGCLVTKTLRGNNPLDIKEFTELLEKYPFTPFLAAATCYDVGPLTDAEFRVAMVQKAYAVLNALGINTENPYLVDVESWISPESSYRLGLFLKRPFTSLECMSPRGDMLAPHELYCYDMSTPEYVFPLRSLVNANTDYIKPCFLPPRQYHLFGTEKLLYTDVTTVVLTPDLREYGLNFSYMGMAVISWYGAEYTIPKVNFAPLAGRTVLYVFNPGSFGGDYQRCRFCMERVMEQLAMQGCNVSILANPLYGRTDATQPPPQMAAISFPPFNATPYTTPLAYPPPTLLYSFC